MYNTSKDWIGNEQQERLGQERDIEREIDMGCLWDLIYTVSEVEVYLRLRVKGKKKVEYL